MPFHFIMAIITLVPKTLANPLPLDSTGSEPYLLALFDPKTSMPTTSSPFIPDNFQPASFASIQVNPILNNQYESTVDSNEPVDSTDLAAVPCQTGQISDAGTRGFCGIELPKDGLEHQQNPPPQPEEPTRPIEIPAVPSASPKLDSDSGCDPFSYFDQHYCCDGPIGGPTEYAGQICIYLIHWCFPCGFKMPPRAAT